MASRFLTHAPVFSNLVQFKNSSHDLVKRLVSSLSSGSNLLFGLSGDLCCSASAHLACVQTLVEEKVEGPTGALEETPKSVAFGPFQTSTLHASHGDSQQVGVQRVFILTNISAGSFFNNFLLNPVLQLCVTGLLMDLVCLAQGIMSKVERLRVQC